MRNFIIGLIVGMTMTGVAWAATYNIILQSADGVAISAANPLPVRGN